MIKKVFSTLLFVSAMFVLCCLSCNAVEFTAEDKISENAVVLTAQIVDGDEDISPAVQPLLEEAKNNATPEKPYVIVIPQGSYDTKTTLYLFSNTTVYMRGASINLNSTIGAVIRGGRESKVNEVGGYDDYENMSIVGGTITSAHGKDSVRFCHAKNVSLIDVTFDGGVTSPDSTGRHLVEVGAIDGFYVTGCTFKNCDRPAYQAGVIAGNGWEALQIDNPCSDYNMSGYVSDGTPMKNVLIENNTFKDLVRAVGSHSSILGVYSENMKIINNEFINIEDEAIVTFNYYNCEISGNTIEAGRGIRIVSINPSLQGCYMSGDDEPYKSDIFKKEMRYDLKTTVSNNTITANAKYANLTCAAITVYGAVVKEDTVVTVPGEADRLIAAGDYSISGITIEDNSIVTNSNGMELYSVKDCTIKHNSITAKDSLVTGSKIYGIFIGGDETPTETGSSIEDNTITNFKDYLICVSNVPVGNITNNTLTSTDGIAIAITGKSKVFQNIDSNKITSAKGSGICINLGSAVLGNISSNTIKSIGEYGILINEKSTVNGGIISNEITSTAKNSIAVMSSSSVLGGIKSNTVLACSGTASIYACKASVVKKSISSNSISQSGAYGIYINACAISSIQNNNIDTTSSGIILCDASVSLIKGNTILCTGTPSSGITLRGIYIYKTTTQTKTQTAIQSNTITGIKDYLICICGVTVDSVSDNILSGGNAGIYIYNGAAVTADIASNKISDLAKSGIYLNSSSAVGGSISSNEISGVGEYGVILSSKSSVNGNIESNTITSSKKNSIAVIGSSIVSGSIIKNTINSCKATAAILVYNLSSVEKGILSNALNSSAYDAINISGSKVNGGIIKNTVTKSAKGNAITIYNASKIRGTISSNIIKAIYSNGIYVNKNSSVDAISSNYINTCSTGYGIILNNSSVTSKISSNTVKNIITASTPAIFIYNSSYCKTMSSNKISAVAGNGIGIYALLGNMTVSSNAISTCKKISIYINPNTTKYTITLTKNAITSNLSGTGIMASTGKLSIYSNTIKSSMRPVNLAKGVVASIYANALSGNKYDKYYIAGKYYSHLSKPGVALKALSKSFAVAMKGSGAFSGYQFKYSKSSSMSSPTAVTVKGTGTRSSTVTDLKKAQTYYVRARVYYKPISGIIIYGNYSTAKAVTCK